MISINATLLLQIIHFLILVFILKRLLYKPIMKLMDERVQYVEEAKVKIANIETETAELVDRCIAMEKSARSEAGDENAKMKKEANTMAEQIFEETRKEVASIKEKAHQEIADQIEIAKELLSKEAQIVSDTITEKVLSGRAQN